MPLTVGELLKALEYVDPTFPVQLEVTDEYGNVKGEYLEDIVIYLTGVTLYDY